MKIFKKFVIFLRKLYGWYREPIPGYRLIRVDPLTVITIIGLITTSWGVGRGIGVKITADNISDSLRIAPTVLQSAIQEAHQANQISGYQHDVALQRVEMMKPIFTEFAEIIQNKGYEALISATGWGLFESVIALNPTGQITKLVGAMEVGRGFDAFITILCVKYSIHDFDFSASTFSEEQTLLRKQIEDVFGKDSDALFRAHMRTTINMMRQEWISTLQENPCRPYYELEKFRASYSHIYIVGVEHLYGPGQKWATKDEFVNWLINEARRDDGKHITKTYEGNFETTNGPKAVCFACVPPTANAKIELTLNLETCKVTGKISGEGTGNTTINQCDENYNINVDELCTASGWLKFNGEIIGDFDPSTGKLNLKPSTITVDHKHQWLACSGEDLSEKSEKWEDTISITGQLDWTWGHIWTTIKGNFNWETEACHLRGDWVANKTDKIVPTKTWADRYLEKHREQ